jgi:hypothetical protein
MVTERVEAASFTVSNTNDSGPGSLREAISSANAAAGADMISFNVVGTILLSGELPAISGPDPLTIDGPGAAKLTVSGNHAVRVLSVASGATLTVKNLKIADGGSDDGAPGGGISNLGTLSVVNCAITGNELTIGVNLGGGIYNAGTLSVSNSTISDNRAETGAGLYNANAGSAVIEGTTFSFNIGVELRHNFAEGGAIFNHGTLSLNNSTIVGNRANYGGCLETSVDTVTISNTTLSGNFPDCLIAFTGTLRNSILTDNNQSSCRVHQDFTDAGNNLDDGSTCVFTQASSHNDTQPGLDPAGLKDNGGPTQTIGLCERAGQPAGCTASSPALDAIALGSNGCGSSPSIDQRGVARPQGLRCDIGAFELQRSFPSTAALDNFNRADGKLGSNWEGTSDVTFYKIAGNRLDVLLGGPAFWKRASFAADQEAFVTLKTVDPRSPGQGLLLKVQSSSLLSAGAISVTYDATAKAVRVSTLRVQNAAWVLYPNKPATFANGDTLGARALSSGDIQLYKNGSLFATVTLNAADRSFFNAKGGKVGLMTAAAANAFFDDFGGGTLAQ